MIVVRTSQRRKNRLSLFTIGFPDLPVGLEKPEDKSI